MNEAASFHLRMLIVFQFPTVLYLECHTELTNPYVMRVGLCLN